MKKNCINILFLLFLFISCTVEKNEFLNGIKNIKGQVINVDCLIGKPVDLFFYDTLLFVYDQFDGKALTVIDMNNNQCKNRQLSIGQGPGEVAGALRFSVSHLQQKLYAFQMQKGMLNIYNIKDDELDFQETILINERPANVIVVKDALIGIGPFEKGRYHVYNMQGNLTYELGDYPNDSEQMDSNSRFFLYQGYLSSKPDGSYFALGSSYSDNIEFFGKQDNMYKLLKKYGNKRVKASFNQQIKLDDNCFLGYKGSYSDERYCYMLYSGKTYSNNNYRKGWATHIFVFQWDGTFIKSFRLDQEVLTFCVDAKNNIIYGVTLYESEYTIIKFEME